ncbi:hypothetical protein FPV67DRAFT_1460810 [Lyophyllum atratum]|nr:hypothetical protein FPV67DRAFT_1460810 [Lyophyllum atratum]
MSLKNRTIGSQLNIPSTSLLRQNRELAVFDYGGGFLLEWEASSWQTDFWPREDLTSRDETQIIAGCDGSARIAIWLGCSYNRLEYTGQAGKRSQEMIYGPSDEECQLVVFTAEVNVPTFKELLCAYSHKYRLSSSWEYSIVDCIASRLSLPVNLTAQHPPPHVVDEHSVVQPLILAAYEATTNKVSRRARKNSTLLLGERVVFWLRRLRYTLEIRFCPRLDGDRRRHVRQVIGSDGREAALVNGIARITNMNWRGKVVARRLSYSPTSARLYYQSPTSPRLYSPSEPSSTQQLLEMPTANSIAAATLASPDRTPSGTLKLTLEYYPRGSSEGSSRMYFLVAQKWGHSYGDLKEALYNMGYTLFAAYVVFNGQMFFLHPSTWPPNIKDMRVIVEKRTVIGPAPTVEDETKIDFAAAVAIFTGVASTGGVSTDVASIEIAYIPRITSVAYCRVKKLHHGNQEFGSVSTVQPTVPNLGKVNVDSSIRLAPSASSPGNTMKEGARNTDRLI